MNKLRDKIAREICIGIGDDPDREGERLTGYDAAADRILTIPEIAEALANEADAQEAVRGGGYVIRANPDRMKKVQAALDATR